MQLPLSGFIFLINIILAYRIALSRVRTRRRVALAAAASLALLASTANCYRAYGGSFLDDLPSSHVADSWRDAKHGGLNALFVLLATHGFNCTYDEVRDALSAERLPASIDEMKALAAKLDYTLSARQFTPEDLAKMPLPALLYLDGLNTKRGAWILLTRRYIDDVEFMNGPTASIHYMRYEDFYRRWSGVGMVVTGRRSTDLATCVAGAAFGATIAGFFYFRAKEKKRRKRSCVN